MLLVAALTEPQRCRRGKIGKDMIAKGQRTNLQLSRSFIAAETTCFD
jgi:hypothetical protein